jgi:biotin operon repressor
MAEIRIGSLFGTPLRTSTLLAIALLGETHAGEIARVLDRSRSRIKDAVDHLELEGVIVGADEGKARRLTLNPRYVAAEELRQLLMKLALQDTDLQQKLASVRRRPRRSGKPV